MWSGFWIICLNQIQDVGLVIQDHVRAPQVVAVCLVDLVTRIKADVSGGAGCQKDYREQAAQGLLVIEDFNLIPVGVAKELTSQGVLAPGYNSAVISGPVLQAVLWGYVAN